MQKIENSSNVTTKATGNSIPVISSADHKLKTYVDYMLHTDQRFKGMSRYVLGIHFYWVESIKTACAGHGFIFFNPNFWDQLSEEKKKTVIAHEIWHLILNHLERGEGYDPDSYNRAADYVINYGLGEDGFDIQGKFGDIEICYDPKYGGMSTEQVYKLIHQERMKNGPNSVPGTEGTPSKDQIEDLVKDALEEMAGEGSEPAKDIAEQAAENAQKADEALKDGQKAAQQGYGIGSETGGTDMILTAHDYAITIKEASYEEIFEKYLTDPLSGGKRTFLRPSRRQIRGGLRLKGKFPKVGKDNRLTHLVYALDVSGSISQAMRRQFLTSAKTLKEKLNPKLMTVILWDTRIVMERTFREDEELNNIHIRAGGGTNLSPVYKRMQVLNPEALVIFTDLMVTIPPQPKWDTIWFVPHKGCSTHAVNYGDVYLIPE